MSCPLLVKVVFFGPTFVSYFHPLSLSDIEIAFDKSAAPGDYELRFFADQSSGSLCRMGGGGDATTEGQRVQCFHQ